MTKQDARRQKKAAYYEWDEEQCWLDELPLYQEGEGTAALRSALADVIDAALEKGFVFKDRVLECEDPEHPSAVLTCVSLEAEVRGIPCGMSAEDFRMAAAQWAGEGSLLVWSGSDLPHDFFRSIWVEPWREAVFTPETFRLEECPEFDERIGGLAGDHDIPKQWRHHEAELSEKLHEALLPEDPVLYRRLPADVLIEALSIFPYAPQLGNVLSANPTGEPEMPAAHRRRNRRLCERR